MKRLLLMIFAVTAVLGLAACSNTTKEKLGLSKKAPNEFLVSPRPPLSLPPEYDLRPVTEPQAGAENYSELSAAEQNLIWQMKE